MSDCAFQMRTTKKYDKKFVSVALVLCGTFFTLLLSGCSAAEKKAPEEIKIAVEVSDVSIGDVNVYRKYVAQAKPEQEVYVIPKVPAKVEEIYYLPGDEVKKGDILFILDDSDISAALNQAAAAVDLAQANYDRVQNGAKEQQLMQVESALSSAKVQFDDAALNLERMKELFAIGGISKQQLEQVESSHALAKVQYDAALKNYNLTKDVVINENINAARAQLNQAKAGYDSAVKQAGDTVMKADIDGVIGFSTLAVGSYTTASAPVMSILDTNTVYMDINVTDDVVEKFSRGDVCEITFESAGEKVFSGTIESVGSGRNPSTGLYSLRVRVENTDGKITSGTLASVKLVTDSIKETLKIPTKAIISEYGENFVYVVKSDNRTEKRAVVLGISGEEETQVKEGLSKGEKVVTTGVDYVADNSLITIAE